MVSGEAILSAENSGKPLGSRGSAPNPAGGAQRSSDPITAGEGLMPLRTFPGNPRPHPPAPPALGLRPLGRGSQ